MSRGSFFGQKAKDIQRCIRNIHSFTDGQAVILDWDADHLSTIMIQVKPNSGLYEGGIFNFLVKFPERYPEAAPYLNCLTNIFHPNICMQYKNDATGNVCLSLFAEWSDARHGLEDVVNAVLFLLNYPNLRDPWTSFISSSISRRAFQKKVRQSLAGMKLSETGLVFQKFVEYDESFDKFDSDYESDYGSDADDSDAMADVDGAFFMNGAAAAAAAAVTDKEKKVEEKEEEMEVEEAEKQPEEAMDENKEENGEDKNEQKAEIHVVDKDELKNGTEEKSENAEENIAEEKGEDGAGEIRSEKEEEIGERKEAMDEKTGENADEKDENEKSEEKNENAEEKKEEMGNTIEENTEEKSEKTDNAGEMAEKSLEKNAEEKKENAEEKEERTEEDIEAEEKDDEEKDEKEEEDENEEDDVENEDEMDKPETPEIIIPKNPLDISELLNNVEAIVTSLKSEDFVDEEGNAPELFSEDVSCSGASDPAESNEEPTQSTEEQTESPEEPTESSEQLAEASGTTTLSRQDTKVLPENKNVTSTSRGNTKRCMSVDALMKQFPRRALTSFVALSRQETKSVLKLSQTMKRLHSGKTVSGEPSMKKRKLTESTASCLNGASNAEPFK